jgi:prepilin-type N-terminal cleavage/methylation domain-containing protein
MPIPSGVFKRMKNKKGFTLIELLVALLIGTLMLMAIYSAVNSAQRSSTGIERKVIAQQDARSALDLMAMEIRMASYNPSLTPNIWVNSTCGGAGTSPNTNRGIVVATANSITIEMDLDANGSIGNISNEIITYTYSNDTVNQYITRETNCGGGQSFLGATAANETSKTVLVVNKSANIPVFRYYDGSGTEITAPVTTNIPNIRKVEITLVLDTAYSDPNSGGRRRIIYSTSVIPRNHIPAYTY